MLLLVWLASGGARAGVPQIHEFTVSPSAMKPTTTVPDGRVWITLRATDPDGDPLNYVVRHVGVAIANPEGYAGATPPSSIATGYTFSYDIPSGASLGMKVLKVELGDTQSVSTAPSTYAIQARSLVVVDTLPNNEAPGISFAIRRDSATGQQLWPAAGNDEVTIDPGTTLCFVTTATDASANLADHVVDLQKPNNGWNWFPNSGFADGPDFRETPANGSSSSKSPTFTFQDAGDWHTRIWAHDGTSYLHFPSETGIKITVASATWTSTPASQVVPGTSLQWTAQASPSSGMNYQFEYSTNGGASWTNATQAANNPTSAAITAGAVGTVYKMRVRVSNSGSSWTTPIEHTVTVVAPPPTVAWGARPPAIVPPGYSLQWEAVASPVSGVELRFERSVDGAGFTDYSIQSASNAYSPAFTAGAIGTVYKMRVSVRNGTSGWVDTEEEHTVIVGAQGTGTGLRGEYYSGIELEGTQGNPPVFVRPDANVHFDWTGTGPGSPLSTTSYSVRWMGEIQPRFSGTYTFTAYSDDGVRLWINGQSLLAAGAWSDHAENPYSGTITLTAGQKYDIRMEYYQNEGGASVKLFWQSALQPYEAVPASQLYPLSGGYALDGVYRILHTTHSGAVTVNRVSQGERIESGPAVAVTPGASVTYRVAGNKSIRLLPGFHAQTGSTFQAIIDGGGSGSTAPDITSPDSIETVAGQPGAYTIAASGSTPMTFGASGLPAWLTFDAGAHTVSGTPMSAGVHTFTVTATNSVDTDSKTVTWTVLAAGPDPLADPDADGVMNIAEANLGTPTGTANTGTSLAGNDTPSGWPGGAATRATSEVPGVTSGQLTVDKNGAATYALPLWVTPGTAGMQPQLALNYSSQAGAGLPGFGWSLGGVSAITRGPQGRAVDGQNRAVAFDYGDRYYLDGQRLIAISGTDGADGTEYRTETESFSRIRSYGTAGQGPAYFKVWTKAGLILEFGHTGDSAFNPGGRTEALSWSVNRISDTKGNSIRFEYDENTGTGEHRIKAIRYTERTGGDFYASVLFEYEDRGDPSSGYMLGSPLARTKRLKRIKSCHSAVGGTDGDVVRTYELGYIEREHTHRSILNQVVEIGADGTRLPALSFTYESTAGEWAVSNLAPQVPLARNEVAGQPRGTGFVDLDGDGRPDFVRYHRWNSDGGTGERDAWVSRNGAWVRADGTQTDPNDPSRTIPDWRLPDNASDNLDCVLAWDGFADFGTRFVDFDGDGRTDLLHALKRNNGVTYCVAYKNTPAGWVKADGSEPGVPDWRLPSGWLGSEGDFDGSSRILDVNGDGRPDIVWNYRNQSQNRGALLNTGSGWTATSAWTPPFQIDADRFFIDVNGDGLPDQVVHWYGNGGTTIGVALNSASGWSPAYTASATFSGGANPISSTTASTHLGALARFLPPAVLTVASSYNPHEPIGSEFVDVNGDGLTDVVFANYSGAEGTRGTYLNTGDGWVASPAFTLPAGAHLRGNPNNPHEPSGAAWLDVNGDGIVDLAVHREGDPGTQGVYLGTGSGFTGRIADATLIPPHYVARNNGAYPAASDFVDLNGDGAIDQAWHLENLTYGARLGGVRASDRLQSVTTGLGVSSTLTYAPLTSSSVYAPPHTYESNYVPKAYPLADVIGPMYVVAQVSHDDGRGGTYPLIYSYGGLRSHATRGSLGFEWTKVTDGRTNVTTVTDFAQPADLPELKSQPNGGKFALAGLPVKTQTIWRRPDQTEQRLSETVIEYDLQSLHGGKTAFVAAGETRQKSWELNGTFVSGSLTETTYSNEGDATSVAVKSIAENDVEDGFGKTTVNTYHASNTSGDNWIVGRLATATVTAVRPAAAGLGAGDLSQTRKSSFEYDAASGLLTTETVEPDEATTSPLRLRTTYGYDAFGNKETVTVTGYGLGDNPAVEGSRVTTMQYDARGRFPTQTANALGHAETYTYHQGLGVVATLTGPNGLATSWTVDGFGRKVQETRADGTKTYLRYRWITGNSPGPDALYYLETETEGGALAFVSYDQMGRERYSGAVNGGILTGPAATGARLVLTRTDYDEFGRAFQVSLPYFAGETPEVASRTTAFDVLGRPLYVFAADEAMSGTLRGMEAGHGTFGPGAAYQRTSYEYLGLTTRVTQQRLGGNSDGEIVAESTRDTRGQTVAVVGNAGASVGATDRGETQYLHDAQGNLRFTRIRKDASTWVSTELVYDRRGRKTLMRDPDMGEWTYEYNAGGELVKQTDASAQVTTLRYDRLGRLVQRVENEGTTAWTYDTAPRSGGTWKGKLHTVTSPDGYSETQGYDTLGRPSELTRTVDSSLLPAGLTSRSFTVAQTYDAWGRPSRTSYPGGYAVFNHYNRFGFLREVRDGRGAASTALNDTPVGLLYWQADSYSKWGGVDAATYGNGQTWIATHGARTGRTTSVSTYAAYGPFQGEAHGVYYSYDTLGNVKSRVDQVYQGAGGPATTRTDAFFYDGLNRLTRHDVNGAAAQTVAYDPLGNITAKSDVGAYTYGSAKPHAVTAAGSRSYSYDANGNMAWRDGQNILWTSFNQARKISAVGGAWSEFAFGAGRQRVVQKQSNGTITVYLGSNFEATYNATSGALLERRHYILTPVGRTAVRVEGGTEVRTRFFHPDALGSIMAVSDEWGRVETRYAYDAWGKQTKLAVRPQGSGPGTAGTPAAAWNNPRGYTDHEMLGDLGLIHMNGRVYDPLLGRFLSADPFVDDASDSQALNRYSYVGNNPLGATDPSGYFKLSLKSVVSIVAAVVISVATYGAASGWAAGWLAANTVWSASTIAFASAVAGGAAAGFASGFAGSLLNGGSIGDAFKAGVVGGGIGAVTAGIAYGIGSAGTSAGTDLETILKSSPRFAAADDGMVIRLYSASKASIVAAQARGILAEAGMAALQGGRAYLMGLGQGIWAAARGTANAVIHPIDTINGVADGLGTLAGRAIYDTAGLGSDAWNGAVNTINDPGRLGYAVGNVVGGTAIGAGISSGVGAISRSLTVAEAASFPRILNVSARNLQKGFQKHGADFGLSGNWNRARAAEFGEAVNRHINTPSIQEISGSYRGQAGFTHYLNPTNGVNVVADTAGNYVTGYRLGANQLNDVLTTGHLW